jgi:hypothetical protein
MNVDPLELERLIEASTRRADTDAIIVAWVEGVVLAAIAAYFVLIVMTWVIR